MSIIQNQKGFIWYFIEKITEQSILCLESLLHTSVIFYGNIQYHNIVYIVNTRCCCHVALTVFFVVVNWDSEDVITPAEVFFLWESSIALVILPSWLLLDCTQHKTWPRMF